MPINNHFFFLIGLFEKVYLEYQVYRLGVL